MNKHSKKSKKPRAPNLLEFGEDSKAKKCEDVCVPEKPLKKPSKKHKGSLDFFLIDSKDSPSNRKLDDKKNLGSSKAAENGFDIPDRFSNVELDPAECCALLKLEQAFGQKLQSRSHRVVTSSREAHKRYGFYASEGHVVELNLTQFSLKNLYRAEKLPSCIDHFPELEALGLRLSKIRALPSSIGNLRHLEYLDLSHNNLGSLPSDIGRLRSLRELKLSNNQLQSLPLSLSRCSNLRHLEICSNAFTSLASVSPEGINLRILAAAHNQITEIPSSVTKMRNLELLDLQANKITSLRPSEGGKIQFSPKLRHFYLKHNPVCQTLLEDATISQLMSISPDFWLHLDHMSPRALTNLPVEFCPEHEKVLRIEIKTLDPIRGWVKYMYICPVEGCGFEKLISPAVQPRLWMAIKKRWKRSAQLVKNRSKGKTVIENTCPPHDIVYYVLNGRYIGRCSKCNVRKEDLLN